MMFIANKDVIVYCLRVLVYSVNTHQLLMTDKQKSGRFANRAITPNGVEIMLDSPSTNSLGIAGLGGKVNNHYGRIFGTATLLSIIGAGVSNAGVSSSDQNNASQTYRTEVANSFGNQADRVLQRNLSIPPTITSRSRHTH